MKGLAADVGGAGTLGDPKRPVGVSVLGQRLSDLRCGPLHTMLSRVGWNQKSNIYLYFFVLLCYFVPPPGFIVFGFRLS